MGKGGSTSSSSASVPAELSPLYSKTGTNVSGLQDSIPLSGFTSANPATVSPLSGTQQKSLAALNSNLDTLSTPLESAPIVQAGQRYFDQAVAPGIINQATLSGIGRSTALTNALSSAQAQSAVPLLQAEQARRDAMIQQGFQGGDVERSVSQETNNADQADFLRRQAIAEQALFGPLGQLPSTFGQTSKTSGGGGGLFKVFVIMVLPALMALANAGL